MKLIQGGRRNRGAVGPMVGAALVVLLWVVLAIVYLRADRRGWVNAHACAVAEVCK